MPFPRVRRAATTESFHRLVEGQPAFAARSGHRLDRRRGARPPGGPGSITAKTTNYCFLLLYITCVGHPLFALLRPGNADPAGGVREPLGRVVERLRHRWPGLEILLRADSAYAR